MDEYGVIVRGDTTRNEITLVFTGDSFADGGDHIRKTLKANEVEGAFFLTGNFYENPEFKNLIEGLRDDGHYLGAHSDRHLLYADWSKRDSTLVTKAEFKDDLERNYEKMRGFGLLKKDAPYFLPPYEWYNQDIANWTKELNLKLVNFSPGTRSTADYTYPEMAAQYRSSDDIYISILDCEEKTEKGMNGFILLVHIGTDPRRKDKFYDRLGELIVELKKRDYQFVSIHQLLN